MTSLEKIDSEEKFLEVYGDVRLPHTDMDFRFERSEHGLKLVEYIPNGHKPENTFLNRFGFIDENNFWKWREACRVHKALYTTIQLHTLREYIDEFGSKYVRDYVPEELFPIVSSDEKGMVSFIPSEKDGKADRRVKMKFGKFFRRYCNVSLTDRQLKYITNEFNAKYGLLELKMATGPKINEIYGYKHVGFSSCMMHNDGDHYFESNDPPTVVYDSPDIALAYLGDDELKTLHARVLINVPKKQYSCVYGNEQLADLLEAEGYTYGDLEGCRLKRIEQGNYIVMPYLDGCCNVSEYDDSEGAWMVVSRRGDYDATSTEGLLYIHNRSCCEHCEELFDQDDSTETYEYSDVCPSCIAEYFVQGCNRYGRIEHMLEEDTIIISDGDRYHTDCIDDVVVYSDWDEEYHLREDCVYSEHLGTFLHRDYAVKVELIEVTGEDYVPENYEIDENEMREVA